MCIIYIINTQEDMKDIHKIVNSDFLLERNRIKKVKGGFHFLHSLLLEFFFSFYNMAVLLLAGNVKY